jgi:hypothetical protein
MFKYIGPLRDACSLSSSTPFSSSPDGRLSWTIIFFFPLLLF